MSHSIQYPLSPRAKPLLIVISGPSGAGKDAILTRMKQMGYPLAFITTVTTRSRRAGERDGIDYHFVSKEKFHEMVTRNELLEWAKVYENWYGVPKEPIKLALGEWQDAVVKVDVQGAATIKRLLPQAVFIFLTPPSTDELVHRLKYRDSETATDLELRAKTAEIEIKQLAMFDYLVLSRRGEIDQAASTIMAIITAEKCRVSPREISLN